MSEIKNLTKYPLDSKEDPRKIFNFQYLTDNNTISYIKNHGRVMFIIRGPPYSKKTVLSDLLRATYPESQFYCQIRLLKKYDEKDDSNGISFETGKTLVEECTKSVERACCSHQPIIIVQNSHITKNRMKRYMELAVQYDYIVIMSSTMYKFDITPVALSRIGGLDIYYLAKSIMKWEDVPPLFTAWFISPNDAEHIRNITFEKLKALVEVPLFRSWLGTDDVSGYFQPRLNLSCLAGYSIDAQAMKDYYFSSDVQKAYGKSFSIYILGYLISKSDIIAVAQLDEKLTPLITDKSNKSNQNKVTEMSRNLIQYGKTTEFLQKENLPKKSSGFKKEFVKGEKVSIEMCRPIHIAQKGFDVFSMKKLSDQLETGLKLMSDCDGNLKEKFLELKDGNSRLFELKEGLWFANFSRKFCFSTIFTGFYV